MENHSNSEPSSSSPIDPDSPTDPAALSYRQLYGWGAVGGFFCIAVNYGLFDATRLEAMFSESRDPITQAIVFGIVTVVTIAAGSVWARVQTPLASVLVALQLGLVAPVAITAALSQFRDNPKTEETAGAKSHESNGTWFVGSVFISRAYAQDIPPPRAA